MKFIKITILFFLLSQSVFSQLDYKKFLGEKGKLTFNKKYLYSNAYSYKLNSSKEDSIITRNLSSSIPEGLLTSQYEEKLSKNKKDSITFEIIMNSRLVVAINTKQIYLIKYRTRSKESISEDLIFKTVKTSTNWEELSISNEEIKILEQILLNSNLDILFQFYNANNDPKYTDINRLKSLVKDNGVINTKKLAEVLKQNKTELSKYLE